ncbi:hypothetical protein DESUT3_38840 [Desulfuromonas versatilis]|uniref:Uncharacterized protein n=1 Tax=Desulfuromonas versatilis TaxID=2802975 RepID=A0ABN6E385_9BACT|nr:hypothetical protein DESUT3_38840 [Desulfuromonas versatilis]
MLNLLGFVVHIQPISLPVFPVEIRLYLYQSRIHTQTPGNYGFHEGCGPEILSLADARKAFHGENCLLLKPIYNRFTPNFNPKLARRNPCLAPCGAERPGARPDTPYRSAGGRHEK